MQDAMNSLKSRFRVTTAGPHPAAVAGRMGRLVWSTDRVKPAPESHGGRGSGIVCQYNKDTMVGRRCLVIGAGLTGAVAAWTLAQQGYQVQVYERADVVGGHVRTEWIRGIPYEPHGAHIFHTTDATIWQLVKTLCTFAPYRHRVLTRLGNRLLTWPLQLPEVRQLEEWCDIERELDSRPAYPDRTNLETYCESIMGATLYRLFVRDYSRKQWGRDPDTLTAGVAYGRIELRDDGNPDYFRDPYQGWPTGGYGELVEAMLGSAQIQLGSAVRLSDLRTLTRPGDPVIVTAPLDDFLEDEFGPLEWRGVRLRAAVLSDVTLSQAAMVVNEPDPAIPWTRTIETKWALSALHDRAGTVVMREFPGEDVKHYPVLDAAGANRARQKAYEVWVAAHTRNPLFVAGRLGHYSYINMDEALRQGIDAAHKVLGR
jgi:UDP-galactopyranose mutase